MDFAVVTPVRTGLWTSISYAVNKISRLARDSVPNSVDHLKDSDVEQLYEIPVDSPPPLNRSRLRERRT